MGLDAAIVGLPFTAVVHSAGVPKALDFFSGVMRDGAQYLWEIPVTPAAATMVFLGARTEEGVLIAACATQDDVGRFVSDLERINAEQASIIRDLYATRKTAATPTAVGLDDFIRLNNDLTNAQRDLASKNAELARSVEWRNLILGMAAHDLRNPLNTIGGFAELLQERIGETLPVMEARALDHIRQASGYMLRIIEDFLDFSRIETGHFTLESEPVDILSLAIEVAERITSFADEHAVSVQVKAPAPIPIVPADRNRLAQVLSNLIGNAVKFAPNGSIVTVSIVFHEPSDTVSVRVQDQGPGIPALERDKLFRPFSRTSAQSVTGEPGTGLGLAICKSVIDAHGGKIGLDGTVTDGAAFVFELPASRRPKLA
ncbi:two-component hybrid sensor and regulator [Paramagnetospirillum magnetotacticum MS-1]|uniref:histidine kinase n=2 Tax=Paramagnetospirillum magnetotacticum TaxID=188 RepID=A0A0C2V690_PARME|nr:two-component hybrid sensor and regulator [Paramagnetospirillum magnetotacticum MS-1]